MVLENEGLRGKRKLCKEMIRNHKKNRRGDNDIHAKLLKCSLEYSPQNRNPQTCGGVVVLINRLIASFPLKMSPRERYTRAGQSGHEIMVKGFEKYLL